MSYTEYIKHFNDNVTDFKMTSTGCIAKFEGKWYSVNGTRNDIQDVRYCLNEQQLQQLNIV